MYVKINNVLFLLLYVGPNRAFLQEQSLLMLTDL